MSSILFKIIIEPVNAEPSNLTKFEEAFYRRSGKPAFIVGKTFDATFKYKNIGEGPFPKGKLIISIKWPNGIIINVPIELENFNAGDEGVFTFKNEGIVSSGYALFSTYLVADPPINLINSEGIGEDKDIFPVYRDEVNMIDPRVSFFGIYAQSAEEFYEFTAMILSTIGLLYLVFEKYIGPFLHWIMIYLFLIELVDRLRVKP